MSNKTFSIYIKSTVIGEPDFKTDLSSCEIKSKEDAAGAFHWLGRKRSSMAMHRFILSKLAEQIKEKPNA